MEGYIYNFFSFNDKKLFYFLESEKGYSRIKIF